MKQSVYIAAYSLCGAAIGYISWGITPALIPITILLAVLYGASKTRLHAFLLMLAYFLTATRGMIGGTINYFGGAPALAFGFWLAASIGFVGIYTILWHKSRQRRTFRFLAGLALLSIPPLGIIGYVSPLTSAGMLFPNAGFIGLGLTVLLLAFCVYFPLKTLAKVTAPIALIAITLNLLNSHTLPVEDWEAVKTHIAYVPNSDNFEAHINMESSADAIIQSSTATNIVFPESTIKTLTPETGFIWKLYAKINDKNIYAGGQVKEGDKYYNTVIRFAPDNTAEVVYRQRMPVPFSMWRPWSDESIEATLFDTPVYNDGERNIGFLICYEQLLVWPYIQSRLAGADTYIGIANHWWFADTTVPNIEEHSLMAWSRLFGLKLESSINI